MTDDVSEMQGGRSAVASVLLALIPVSVIIALIVLIGMATNVASATGGCGGG
jgi:hypothetical protein